VASSVVLRKALDAQQPSAAQLLQALPPPAPSPAISGSLGTQVDSWA
jgi:Putative motility protein